MRSIRTKIFFASAIFLTSFLLAVQTGEAATCAITSAKWSKNTVKVGESIQAVITVQNPTDCSNKNIGVQVFESDAFGDDSIAGPLVKKFAGTSNTVNYDHAFTVQEWESGGGENPGTIYFTVSVESQSGYTKSNPIFLYPAQGGNGGTTISNFNVSSSQGNLNFTFRVDIPRPGELKSFCGADPFWRVVEINPIKLVRNGQFALDKTNYKFDFSQSGQANNKTYQGTIICAGKDVAVSQPISCNSEGVCQSGGGGTCGGLGQPACKPGETKIFKFEIPNPLKGGATDLGGLVKIIAQWLFNLAIPIAVIMIIYAGVLFLTARGNTTTIQKAKDVLKYAVIGLAIILIGSGFVTLIQSILELGGPPTTSTQKYSCDSSKNCVADPNGTFTEPTCNNSCGGATTVGAVGNKCSRDRDCLTGLKCNDSICQRATGNWVGEPCNSGANCDVGLSCDKSSDAIQPIDGQTLGTCFQTSAPGGRIGDICQRDSDCISGLKCNQICQRKDGNLNGEACLKTSSPPNCKSRACRTVGAEIRGDCVEYSGT